MEQIPSRKTSMTSQIVFLLVICVIIMQVIRFKTNGDILEIFNTLVSGFVGAYLQRQVSKMDEKKKEEIPAGIINKEDIHGQEDNSDIG